MKNLLPTTALFLLCSLLTNTAFAQQLSINERSHIVMNGNVSLVVNNASLNNDGNFIAGAGKVAFTGDTDSTTAFVAGSKNTNFYNLSIIKNSGAVALKSTSAVVNELSVTSGTLYTDSNLVLKSYAATTARVAPVPAAARISGKVKVERFIPARRAWRMLTAPVSGTASIFNTWQNSGLYEEGINTFITGPGASAANGLDASPQNNISMKTWNAATQQFNNVTNTNVQISAGSNGSADNTGYFIFVRGDRNESNFSTAACNATTLSSVGNLQTGAQTFNVAGVSGAYTMVGNPYASPVDFSALSRNNLVNRFYVWDPTLNVLGGYVMLDDIRNRGNYTKSVAASKMTKEIQSGQAFLVQTRTNAPASLVFQESDKAVFNNTNVFRPAGNAPQSIDVSLGIVTADSTIIADGILAEFSEEFGGAVDQDDALKFTNINENIAFVRNGITLAAERRPLIDELDTLYIKLWKTTINNYSFDITFSNFYGTDMFLQDTYLGISVALNTFSSNKINFSIDANAASAATSRFRIIFRKYIVLPVTLTSIVATKQNDQVAVQWKVENEVNITKYTVERSVNGIDFSEVGTVKVAANSNQNNTYTWFDVTPAQGANFYRIRIYDQNGTAKYSGIVRINNTKTTGSTISIYPNPVTNNRINLLLGNQPKGNYHATLYSITGQVVYNHTISCENGNGVMILDMPSKLVPGTYQLETVNPDGVRNVQALIAE